MNGIPDLPSRALNAHKGSFGRVLVLAGSTGMVGAAALTGDAALRSGAGLVTIGTPKSVYPILAAKTTCCLTRPLLETPAGTLALEALGDIRELAARCDVVALGPGLGRHESTTKLVHRLIAEVEKPMVVDADALNALAEDINVLKNAPAPRILTPHPGEMSRLTGRSVTEIQADRTSAAQHFAKEYGVILLLKGHGTVVSDGDHVYVNATGNPGMASGGTGDVLTGMIAALLAQGLPPFDAARLGAHLHGLAGDIAAERLGQTSLIATDLLTTLPEAFQQFHRT
jgi:NAD(P)H-hydrate epimerase